MQNGFYDPRVAAVLLAAGASSRMGDLKQLLPVSGMPLVERALLSALDSHLDRLVLVLGHRARDIERTLGKTIRNPRLTIVYNQRYRQGISTSLVAGIQEIAKSHDHAMVLLADMPFIDRRVIDCLIEAHVHSRRPIGAVKLDQRAAHPIVFRRDLFPELEMLTGDTGARSLLKKYAGQICFIRPDGGYDHRDIDTKEDYQTLEMDLKERKKQWPTS